MPATWEPATSPATRRGPRRWTGCSRCSTNATGARPAGWRRTASARTSGQPCGRGCATESAGALLLAVHRGVGLAQQLLGGAVGVVVVHGDADAGAHLHVPALEA